MAQAVKTYYEQNTGIFLWLKRKGAYTNIHQPLWAKKDFTLEEASNYSNQLILEEIQSYLLEQSTKNLQVYDLGCGVGSVVFYLTKSLEAINKITGLSISAKQIAIANTELHQNVKNPKISFIEADFLNLPKELPSANIAYSIEAFVHAQDATSYFKSVKEKLIQGGKLILIDDFIASKVDETNLEEQDKKTLERFRYGWVLGSLESVARLQEKAKGFRLVKEVDLSPFLNVYTLKERFIRFGIKLFHPFFKQSEYFKSLIGGDARQACLQRGLIEYKMLVFEHIGTTDS